MQSAAAAPSFAVTAADAGEPEQHPCKPPSERRARSWRQSSHLPESPPRAPAAPGAASTPSLLLQLQRALYGSRDEGHVSFIFPLKKKKKNRRRGGGGRIEASPARSPAQSTARHAAGRAAPRLTSCRQQNPTSVHLPLHLPMVSQPEPRISPPWLRVSFLRLLSSRPGSFRGAARPCPALQPRYFLPSPVASRILPG